MAFWKKSEDPWDIDPEKRRRQTVPVYEPEPEEPPAKEKWWPWQKKQEPEEVVPETCPWCGKPMDRGYLCSGRDRLQLSDQKPSALLGTMMADTVELWEEDFWVSYKSCWQCKACRKVIADIPEPVAFAAGYGQSDRTAVQVKAFPGEDSERQDE